MEWFEGFVTTLDYILNTKRKRHITGGILLSISALFGGLAVTIITADKGDNTNGNRPQSTQTGTQDP